jgi:hypothetical protein
MYWHRRAGHPVDTHVLVYHSRQRKAWLEQCLASLENEPTNVLVLDHPTNSVGEARAIAMREGDAPYLSFVDDDDWVMPGAFAACLAPLEADNGLVGAYTDFTDVDADTGKILRPYVKGAWSPRHQLTRPFEVLHVHVYRRAPSMRYLDEMSGWITLEESLLMGLLVQHGDWIKVDFDGYRKRLHSFGAGSRVTKQLLLKLGDRLAPIMIPRCTELHPSPVRRAAYAAVRVIDNADGAGRGCRGCKAVRQTARSLITRTLRR